VQERLQRCKWPVWVRTSTGRSGRWISQYALPNRVWQRANHTAFSLVYCCQVLFSI